MPATLPLDITIQNIMLAGFNPNATTTPSAPGGSGGTPPIVNFPGSPLFCHATFNNATGNIDFTFDELPPNSFLSTGGKIGKIQATYVMRNGFSQTITWNVADTLTVQYGGGPLEYSLAFTTDDLTVATLRIAPPALPRATDPTARIGIVVLKAQIASPPVGYFVDVPLNVANFRDFSAIGLSWSKPGGISGPIGGGTVP